MAKGIDVAQDASGAAQGIVGAGYSFVGRYDNRNVPEKNLTKAEAQKLSSAGLFIVAVWENGFPTRPEYFSSVKGIADGTAAYHFALEEIGQPPGTPIYFAVDFDAIGEQITGGIRDYFLGVKSAFDNISGGNPAYTIGVYGSGCVSQFLRAHTDFVTHSWLALSTGWCGFDDFKEWNIKQLQETTVLGMDVDTNVTNGNGGGFQVR